MKKSSRFTFIVILPFFVALLHGSKCFANTKDYWLKGVRESTGQGYGNIHFVIAEKEDKIEYRVDACVKVLNDEIIQNGTYVVDSNLLPISFDVRFKSLSKNMNIKGNCSNNIMDLSIIDENGKVQNQKLPFRDTYFDVVQTDLILKRAKEKHFKANIFDPTGLMTQGVPGIIQELQIDITKAGKDEVEATVTNSMTTKRYHVSRQGQINQIKFVEQNVRLYATDATDAKDISYLSGSSIEHKTNKTFPNATGYGITKAHIRLTWKNLPIEKFCFEDNRQKLTKQISDNNEYKVILEFTKANTPSAVKIPINHEVLGMYLKDSGYVKPDDPTIRQQLVEIIGDEKDAYAVAEKIIRWTSSNIKFTLNAPYLSAPELLKKRTGHCTHYAILFASFARAAGIPTKMVTGFLNIRANPHLWGPHMWNEIWVGEWIAVDPTRGVFVTGPSHIKFAEASTVTELQGVISRLENNLNIEILDFIEKNGAESVLQNTKQYYERSSSLKQIPNWVSAKKLIKSSEIPGEDHSYLSQWLDNHSKQAQDYMLRLFDKHQVVILGEEHNVKEHKDFVINLIPRLYHEAGVRCIGWEFSWYGLNDRLEELVNAPNYDEEAVLQFARDCNPGWNSKEHWEIIKAVWKLNKKLKAKSEKMRLVGLPDYVDIDKMYTIVKTKPKDSPEFQGMLKETLEADKIMAQHVEEEILQKGIKGLVFVGMGHDWTQYQYPPEVTFGISCKFMGTHLKEKYGDKVFQVRAQASSDPAIINQIMNDKDHISIGFDIQDSPFANILVPVGKGAPDVPWSKLACGYLYLGSRTSFHCNTAIKYFVNEQMFDKYKDYYEVDYGRSFNSAKEVDEYLQQHRWPKPN